MNSLLVNAGIPQMRCVFAGGRYVYEQKITATEFNNNYQTEWVSVDVAKYWEKFNEMKALRGTDE